MSVAATWTKAPLVAEAAVAVSCVTIRASSRASTLSRVTHVAVTLAEQPDLREQAIPDADIWPEFNLQGETYLRLWPRLTEDLPEFQFAMCDEQTREVGGQGP